VLRVDIDGYLLFLAVVDVESDSVASESTTFNSSDGSSALGAIR
jgi:hypothetical protein